MVIRALEFYSGIGTQIHCDWNFMPAYRIFRWPASCSSKVSLSGSSRRRFRLGSSRVSGIRRKSWIWRSETSKNKYQNKTRQRTPYAPPQTDISRLTASDIAQHQAQLWLLSPSCQPYTVLNPNAKGEDDPRAASFLHLIRKVLPELHASYSTEAPRWILIENVAGFEVVTFVVLGS